MSTVALAYSRSFLESECIAVGKTIEGIGRMAVGIGRLFGLHLLQGDVAPSQLKPADPLEKWVGAKAWGRRQRAASKLPEIYPPEGSQVSGCPGVLRQVT